MTVSAFLGMKIWASTLRLLLMSEALNGMTCITFVNAGSFVIKSVSAVINLRTILVTIYSSSITIICIISIL